MFGALGTAIGNRRMVLLGENGHGVAEFTREKVRLVRYLHEQLGFTVLAMESGFWECSTVGESLDSLTAAQAVRRCLTYAMEHAELVPLFEMLKSPTSGRSPLKLSGIDLQLQAGDSRARPVAVREELARQAPALADTLYAIDSGLVAATAAGGEALGAWVRSYGAPSRILYDSAARLTSGRLHWTFRTTSALIDRLVLRQSAVDQGAPVPAAFWGSRDVWMASTVAWLADPARIHAR